jgi:hypothetical protein
MRRWVIERWICVFINGVEKSVGTVVEGTIHFHRDVASRSRWSGRHQLA